MIYISEISTIGADGLTTEQWIQSSNPGTDLTVANRFRRSNNLDKGDNEYRIAKKNGEVVGVTQTGTQGGDMFDKITTVDLDKPIPYASAVTVTSVTVSVVEASVPNNDDRYIRLPGVIIINTWNRASGSAGEGLDLTTIIPTKAGLKILAGGLMFGLKNGIKVATKGSIWTATKKLSPVENAFAHFKKHGIEFPQFYNSKQYVEGATNFLHHSPVGTLMKVRPNGDILKYHPGSNTFGVMNASGIPRTMFKPTDGLDYWLKQ